MEREHERAMTIAYTSLWQLRELDPAGEPSQFRAARIELRRRLDQADALEAPASSVPRKRRGGLRRAALSVVGREG